LAAEGKAGVLDAGLSYDLAKESFINGSAAFWLTGPWSVAAVKEAGMNVAVDVIPTPGPNAAAPFAGVKSFFLNSESKNKVAATDFLVNFLATEDVQVALYEANGILPANANAAEVASADPIVAGFKAVGDTAVPMPAIPEMASVWSFWGVAEVGIIGGAAEATPAWEKLTADVTAAIAQ
jgi:arabinogalactan oligomer / maltooligosaccharide transport system substrate-binding protein